MVHPLSVPWVWLPSAFVLGAMIGSLLNVCILRMPLGRSLWWPGSCCNSCLRPIAWYDNLPLVSYCWLRGRCRQCQASFSIRYFWIELLMAVLFALLWYLDVVLDLRGFTRRADGGRTWSTLPYLVPVWFHHVCLASFLVGASFLALSQREVPRSFLVLGTMVGVVETILLPWPTPLWRSISSGGLMRVISVCVGGLAGYAIMELPRRLSGRLLVGTDVGVMLLIGIYVGWQAAVMAGVVGLVSFVAVRAVFRRQDWSVVPFVSAATLGLVLASAGSRL